MASNDNKWKKPTNPPPPLFLGEKERNLVKQVNDELLERVIGQQILYLPISIDRTNFHPLYGEAIEKSFLPPVRVYALVEFEGIGTVTEHYGLDKSYSITVRFHERRLFEDQDLYVREGDYIQYGTSFFEIVELNEGRQLFGQVDHLFQIEATCIRTRKGLIDLEVLPPPTAAQVAAADDLAPQSRPSTAASLPEPGPSGTVVRLVYSLDLKKSLPAGSMMNTILGAPTTLSTETTAVYEDGARKTLGTSATSGEFYIESGRVYNTFDLVRSQRILVEVLTLI